MFPTLVSKGTDWSFNSGSCKRLCGATVARLTPDQKVACSNHVRVTQFFFISSFILSALTPVLRYSYWTTQMHKNRNVTEYIYTDDGILPSTVKRVRSCS